MRISQQATSQRLWLLTALAIVSIGVAGCDSGPATAPVHGKVSFQGKPVTTGTVRFYPVDGGAAAVGPIQSDGTYELARKVPGDEVLLGDYKVTIEAVESTGSQSTGPMTIEEELEMDISQTTSTSKRLVPEKYSVLESSDLTATVESGDNQKDFNLE